MGFDRSSIRGWQAIHTSDSVEGQWRREVEAVRLRPHPYEFVLYYDL